MTLTGVNSFTKNTSNGLTVFSYGSVALTQAATDANGNAGLLIADSPASVTITCGRFTGDSTGIQATFAPTIHLIGVVFAGNTTNIVPRGYTVTTARDCPMPYPKTLTT